jgi:hypothetical protein
MKTLETIDLIIFAIVCAMITGEVLAFNLAMLNPSNFKMQCFMAMAVVLLVDTGYVLVMAAAICMLKDLWNIIQNNETTN